MAEKTNVVVATFAADNASMCGFGSDGVAALHSVYSLVRYCSHQFVFTCFKVLFKSTPPLCAISCKALRGHDTDQGAAPSKTTSPLEVASTRVSTQKQLDRHKRETACHHSLPPLFNCVCMCECAALMLTQNRYERNDLGM